MDHSFELLKSDDVLMLKDEELVQSILNTELEWFGTFRCPRVNIKVMPACSYHLTFSTFFTTNEQSHWQLPSMQRSGR
jgi:hypothetical protein